VHPFDIKAALLEKHAQHVAIIHFPIALFAIGVLFDFLAGWRHNKPLAAAASYNLVAAGLSALPAAVSGFLAWQFALRGTRLKGILLDHLVLGLMSTCLLIVVGWLHYRSRPIERSSPPIRLILELAGVLLIVFTGHLGGFLSGVNGSQ
jgi:uncharacterized membrane protein